MLEIYCREARITGLMGVARQLTAQARPDAAAETRLGIQLNGVIDRLHHDVDNGIWAKKTILPYPDEEELLSYADQATDFLILEMASHFRRYNQGRLLMPAARYVSAVRDAAIVLKRFSGHVTSSFAEAMCPWVLEQLGISDGTFCRCKGLAPTGFGDATPDLFVSMGMQEIPCEVKHYADESRIRWQDGIGHAVCQVAAALLHMPATEGIVFVAVAHPGSGCRYRVEVIRLAA